MTNVNYENVIKAVELLNGELTFNFKSAEQTATLKLADLPAETIASLLDYGTRKLNDKVNSLFAANPEIGRSVYVNRVLEEAKTGKLGERRTQSNGNVGLRNYIFAVIKSQGVPAKALEEYKGATPQAVINGIYASKEPEMRARILTELTKRYEASLALIDGLDLKLDN